MENFLVFVICLIPFVRYYDIPGTSVSSVTFLLLLAFVLCLLCFATKRNRHISSSLKGIRKSFAIFGLWAFLVTAFYEMFTDINASNPASSYTLFAFVASAIVFFIIYSILFGVVDLSNAIKIYSYFVYLVVGVYLFQLILILVGANISFKLPFHSFNSSWSALENTYFGMGSSPTSLFSERAHMCQYLLPYVAICLFSKKAISKKRFIKAIVVSIVIASTISGNGIVCLGILWLLYFLIFGQFSKKKKAIIAFFGVSALFLSFVFLRRIEAFNDMFSHLFFDSSNSSYHYSKAEYRIYRGFDYFRQLPLLQKITGVGFKHMETFSYSFGIKSIYDNDNSAFEYFSSVFQALLYFGIIGLSVLVFHLFALFKTKKPIVAGMAILMVSLWFSSQMLLDEQHLFYMLLIIAGYASEIKKEAKETLVLDSRRALVNI